MNEKCPELSKRQLKAIPLILSARSITDGIEKAGISRSSFYDWMQDQSFKAEFDRQRKQIVDESLHKFKISIDKATDTLLELLGSESDGVRYRTATSIIENVLKSIQIEHLEERLTKIEKEVLKK